MTNKNRFYSRVSARVMSPLLTCRFQLESSLLRLFHGFGTRLMYRLNVSLVFFWCCSDGCVSAQRKAEATAPVQHVRSSSALFISYIQSQGGLENITEMDLANYRELKNL